MTNHLQAKKYYVQAVSIYRTFCDINAHSVMLNCVYQQIMMSEQDLQRLGIEPNYSLIVTELKHEK